MEDLTNRLHISYKGGCHQVQSRLSSIKTSVWLGSIHKLYSHMRRGGLGNRLHIGYKDGWGVSGMG